MFGFSALMLYGMAMVPGAVGATVMSTTSRHDRFGTNQTVLLLCPPGEPGYRWLALSVLRLEDGRVAEAVDFRGADEVSAPARFQQGRGRI
ncbi:hypothetical protein [Mesorhizobium sp. M1027]|uniref:hypothetical protein n=1 Tax=Mesorhizobium sp. M1027 TaxID=2957050 RepID=UPI0033378952